MAENWMLWICFFFLNSNFEIVYDSQQLKISAESQGFLP